MCFTERNQNVLAFPLGKNWKASIEIACTGTFKKQVVIAWNFSGSGGPVNTYNMCTDGPNKTYVRQNLTLGAVIPTITLTYDNAPCSNPGPTLLPLTDAEMEECLGGLTTNYSRWTFMIPGQSGDTVEVTIAAEEQPGEG
jgi:hypothetical protein